MSNPRIPVDDPRPDGRPVGEEGPLVGVLGLQGGVEPHLRALAAVGARTRLVRRAGELADLDGIVIPGGESTTILRLLDVFGLRVPLAARLAGGLAAYGSCAGLIVLAGGVLDGRPDQVPLRAIDAFARRNAFGRQRESFQCDLEISGMAGPPIRASFIRAPWLERVGPGVRVLATVDGRAVVARQGRVLVTSFHPEISAELRVHRMFLRIIAEGGILPTSMHRDLQLASFRSDTVGSDGVDNS